MSEQGTDTAREIGHALLAFHRGILAALTVVAAHDAETLHHEIVQMAGAENLIAACETRIDYEDAGFARYATLRGYRWSRRPPRGGPR